MPCRDTDGRIGTVDRSNVNGISSPFKQRSTSLQIHGSKAEYGHQQTMAIKT